MCARAHTLSVAAGLGEGLAVCEQSDPRHRDSQHAAILTSFILKGTEDASLTLEETEVFLLDVIGSAFQCKGKIYCRRLFDYLKMSVA